MARTVKVSPTALDVAKRIRAACPDLSRRDLSVEAFQAMCRDVTDTAWEDPS